MTWKLFPPLLLICLYLVGDIAKAKPEKFILDTRHSNVQWHIDHFGFSNPSGKWMASGILILDKDNPSKSHISVTIPIARLITGIPELDRQLKSDQFFDVSTFPTATFISNQVIPTDDKTAKVKGTLTLHGISKPIMLYVMINKVGENPWSKAMTVGFSAVTEIKRSDFNITSMLPELSDRVMLTIEAEAIRKNPEKTLKNKELQFSMSIPAPLKRPDSHLSNKIQESVTESFAAYEKEPANPMNFKRLLKINERHTMAFYAYNVNPFTLPKNPATGQT